MSQNSSSGVYSQVEISIEDYNQEVKYADLKIDQRINDHHHFSFLWRLDLDLISDLDEQENIARKYLGKSVGVTLGDYYFNGLINRIELSASDQMSKGLLISGVSPTILIDEIAHNEVYEEVDFDRLVEEALNDVPQSLLSSRVDAVHTERFPFLIQYNETDFQFLRRMCRRWGEYMYYNGEELIIGPPKNSGIALKNGEDLYTFGVSSTLRSSHFRFLTYDPIVGEGNKEVLGKAKAPNSDFDLGAISNTSAKIFRQNGNKLVHLGEYSEQGKVDQIKKLKEQAYMAGLILFHGHSKNTNLRPGEIVNIDRGNSSGDYIITQVSHQSSIQGRYENTFEAIPGVAEVPHYTDPQASIICEAQSAVVADNKDPEGLGRVRVNFHWNKSIYTPWLRIVTPHSGADKGFYFTPEIGEEVLVGFQGGNADRPYIMGSFFNGKAKPKNWVTDDNDIKAIRTRSGHTIEFNDKKGAESIKIYDNEGSIITYDTHEKSLFIHATENLELGAKNIKIIAEENVEIQAKADINTISEGSTNVISKKDSNVRSKGNVNIESESDAIIEGKNVNVEAKAKATLSGNQTFVKGKITKVTGASAKIDVL